MNVTAAAAPAWWPALPDASAMSWRDGAVVYGLSTFVVHEVMWAMCNAPYIWIERHPERWRRYKLQPTRSNSYAAITAMAWRMVLEHVLIVLPAALAAGALVRTYVTAEWSALPSVGKLCAQLLCAELIHDVVFYVLHVWLHTPWMYRHVHKVHHENTAPFALAGEHAHAFESVFAFIGPVVCGFVGVAVATGEPLHVVMVWLMLLIENVQSVEGHSGYLMPWHKDRWAIIAWFNGGAPHHDGHHIGFHYNFGARWTDLLFGTTEWHYRRNAARAKRAPTSAEREEAAQSWAHRVFHPAHLFVAVALVTTAGTLFGVVRS